MARQPAFTPAQDIEIAAAYNTGESAASIATRYGTSDQPVLHALQRQGVQRRGPGGSVRTWTGSPEQRADVVHRYTAGTPIYQIAKDLRLREEDVSTALRDAGVPVQIGGGSKRRLFDDATEADIASQYADGATLAALASAHGTNTATIRNALRRAGMETRQAARPKVWTDERHNWLIEQYQAGRSQQELADEVGVSQQVLGARLRTLGVLAAKRARLEQHGSWKGGRKIIDGGYTLVRPADDDLRFITARSNGYVLENRLVMARYLGRPLTDSETVHHIDGTLDPDTGAKDNDLSNLQLRQGRHGTGEVAVCNACGSHDVGFERIADPEG